MILLLADTIINIGMSGTATTPSDQQRARIGSMPKKCNDIPIIVAAARTI
jgi:hypothetical protein